MKYFAQFLVLALILPACNAKNATDFAASNKVGAAPKTDATSVPTADDTSTTDDQTVASAPASAPLPSSTVAAGFFAKLDSFRWEMPCDSTAPRNDQACNFATGKVTSSITIAGDPSTTYAVDIWVRGVAEGMLYKNGAQSGSFHIGGTPDNAALNVYSLTTSSPPQTYYMNAIAAFPSNVQPIEIKSTIHVKGGSTLTMVADAQNGDMLKNLSNVTVPNLPTPSGLESGQWMQVNVTAVKPLAN
ncbi:MAG: hypothetical protein H7249_01750 [Chitinophagaceae bacterium]|nr:hypothetical protein [Oligoflexus sp.]